MGCEVYANGDEIACKAGDNKVIAAMPDVCLSPPSPPAGPVPVPYPNTAFSKDMQNGSKTVMIKDKEIMLKDQSFYKTSPLGDEAATNGLGAGVITHVITGKTYCISWSMDVQFEGQNVDRHTDMTTSNHASPVGNRGVPAPTTAVAAAGGAAAATNPPDKCKCCGQDMHSQAQKDGKSMSEDQFYDTANNPANKKLIDEVRADPNCKDILPDPSDAECNKYYQTTVDEKKATVRKWKNAKRAGRYPGQWAHKVPKAAGGCATGKNVSPVKPECAGKESALALAQENQMKALGWR